MHFSASLAAAAILLVSSVKAQDVPIENVSAPPPTAAHNVNITYANDNNVIVATEYVPFNKCVASEAAFGRYSYLNFAPNNATINFYKDSSCKDFTFGLDGYYGGYPGQARSYMWVGWSTDSLGEFFHNAIQGQGDAANNAPGDVPGTNPGSTPPTTPNTDKQEQTAGDSTKTNDSSSSSSSTFFGGVVGSLVVLSVGGVIFWKTAGKKMVEDKGKGVLPYNRVNGQRDGDILLTSSRGGNNSFEIGDEDDEEDDEVDHPRQQRSGRQDRYHDDDQA
ncbi:hypothetical protein EMPS_05621 [Entomortierella parvispora]|uniref:Mid2 domain-containing protein n=1 Tax=Entomortierella parvispora TaxID=205924 RepID=A0A9P3HBB2_9FUNG|nr:hypothetical protein EMPS_05621 [Entomortierella parvispora]